MKEYESKSIEELRYEDYLANRKAPSQTNAFGSTTGTSLFSSGATTTGTGFGSNLFGGSSTQTTANRPLLFGGTGTTTASTTSPQTTSLFGQTQASTAAKPGFFGSTTTPAATTTSGFSGFGTQPATQVCLKYFLNFKKNIFYFIFLTSSINQRVYLEVNRSQHSRQRVYLEVWDKTQPRLDSARQQEVAFSVHQLLR